MSEVSCKFTSATPEELKILDERSERVALILKTLAHPERLKALCQLAEGEKPVALLQQLSNLSPSALSQHLAVLRNNDIIQMRKESQCVFYSIKDERIYALLNAMDSCL